MSITTAARRYAKALFALSSEQQAVDAVHTDLESLVGLMDISADWKSFVLEPFGSMDKRSQLLESVFTTGIHPLTRRFLVFIDQKHRISSLKYIQAEWVALYNKSKGILQARVISAKPLSDSQQSALSAKLNVRFGKNIILTTGLDPAMIGGIKVVVGDQVFDYSIETQLQMLQKQMIYA